MGSESPRKKRYTATSFGLYSISEERKLTNIISTLPPENDDQLKKFIESRLSRGSVFPGTGQIGAIDLGIEPANCYFCLLNPYQKEDEQYMVCFVTECNRGLDSFRYQLDQHSAKVEATLKECGTTVVIDKVKPILEKWYQDCLLFIVNCVQTLGKDIKYVIYNAVANGQMSIDTEDKQLEIDLERFHSSCTLSALLNQTAVDSESDTSGSMIDMESEPRSRTKCNVDILCVTCRNGQAASFSSKSVTKFCEDWAQVLFEKLAYSLAEHGDVNPLDLKVISENFKIKTIQDMNTLKRMVKQAELDFYALYRSYMFLKKSGNVPILLMHAMNEEQNGDSLAILKLLKEYVEKDNIERKINEKSLSTNEV